MASKNKTRRVPSGKKRCRGTRKNPSPYNDNDYSSSDGMLTRVWGPSMWHFLHTMSFNYPVKPSDETKKQYTEFVHSLQHVLPCGKCRDNLTKNLCKLPIRMRDLVDRRAFSTYIFNLHELINEMTGKTSGLTYDGVREQYEHFRARCSNDDAGSKSGGRRQTKKHPKIESGCTEPLYGKKSKCVIKIVDADEKVKTFHVNKSCKRSRNKSFM